MTPADELRAAAARLRPSSPSVAEHTVAVHITPAVAEALADLLESAAQQEAYTLAEWGHRGGAGPHALAVARAVLGSSDG